MIELTIYLIKSGNFKVGEGYDAAKTDRPWDIALRAHILLRSSEFGLSGFHNYVQKGVNEGRRPELVGGGLIREKVSIEELTSGSRRKEVSAIRGRRAIGLVEK